MQRTKQTVHKGIRTLAEAYIESKGSLQLAISSRINAIHQEAINILGGN